MGNNFGIESRTQKHTQHNTHRTRITSKFNRAFSTREAIRNQNASKRKTPLQLQNRKKTPHEFTQLAYCDSDFLVHGTLHVIRGSICDVHSIFSRKMRTFSTFPRPYVTSRRTNQIPNPIFPSLRIRTECPNKRSKRVKGAHTETLQCREKRKKKEVTLRRKLNLYRLETCYNISQALFSDIIPSQVFVRLCPITLRDG